MIHRVSCRKQKKTCIVLQKLVTKERKKAIKRPKQAGILLKNNLVLIYISLIK